MATKAKYPQANGNMGGESTAITTQDPTTPAIDELGQAEVLAMMRPASTTEINARIQAGDLESAPILFAIPEGQQITCEILRDDVTTIEDVATRQPKTVKIWILRMLHPTLYQPGPTISILGSAQLDRQLPPFLGCVVVIARGGTAKTNKGRQLTEWFVGLDKRAPQNKGQSALPIIAAVLAPGETR